LVLKRKQMLPEDSVNVRNSNGGEWLAKHDTSWLILLFEGEEINKRKTAREGGSRTQEPVFWEGSAKSERGEERYQLPITGGALDIERGLHKNAAVSRTGGFAQNVHSFQ